MSEPDRNLAAALSIARLTAERGGRAYFVGGCVRDFLCAVPCKDLDLEIHGIFPDTLESILDCVGERISIGESFGIYALKGLDLDIAMPRREKAIGSGHKAFDVIVDPFIGIEKAAMRRDFTINAMLRDVLTGEILDPFNGRRDLKARLIRHVSDSSFAEDPLRALRGAQFAARFGFEIADETIKLCKTMELSALAKERVEGELKKALLSAPRPSAFFWQLRRMEQLGFWFKECEALIGIEQNPRFHAEGDVWTHTMMVLDEAAKLKAQTNNPYGFMLGALVHDFGKALTTEKIDGLIHAYGHETEGLPVAEGFLRRITNENKTIEYALALAKYHMKPNILAHSGAKIKATNKMFDSVPDPQALICIALADARGQIAEGEQFDSEAFLRDRLEIYREYMARPYVTGKDLVKAGLSPTESFTELLTYAHKLRLAGVDKECALRQTLALAAGADKRRERAGATD